jgi:hypothetical protein
MHEIAILLRVVTSSWLTAVGAEYGVGAGSVTTLADTRSTMLDIALPLSTATGSAIRMYGVSGTAAAYQFSPWIAMAGAPCSSDGPR